MPLWLQIVGGLLVFGYIIDLVAKKRGGRINPGEKAKPLNDDPRNLPENIIHQANMNNQNHGPN
ncbi:MULTISPECIES: hypothetical protein [Virgibacillus]|jgi:hypothetical protein|uniref:Uncharacterized protein n=1 Tax=Virgibacillus halodenitrificans TaxID=1482 RepID=A0AAC9J259_VIRHA|nr:MULTISPECIES: hypothetical protein [Virgibacillus]AIF44786.1 hypothetical protein X953_17980 [Virgibacillus sp. SK37]APC49873.1 hypothetical protein BME96_17455 [Virgibacillus halodenitrificans]MBD1223508.1 hypothetical protein [Virgibacillus halodenitrificans]MCG1029135.1 hypothetical protein [Virgibacillus halodenitrificans]MCJ0932744.1 hypothetical protein [Virgibacillus halodenitrificans]